MVVAVMAVCCAVVIDSVVVQEVGVVIVYEVAIVRATRHVVDLFLVVVIICRPRAVACLTRDVVTPGTGSGDLDLDLQLGQGYAQSGASRSQGQSHQLDSRLIHCHTMTCKLLCLQNLVPSHRLQRSHRPFHLCFLLTKVLSTLIMIIIIINIPVIMIITRECGSCQCIAT